MDFLKPNTLWINDRCYRVLNGKSTDLQQNYMEDDLYPDENKQYEDELDCGITDIPVEQLQNGKYSSSLHVASVYYGYIIGGKGATRRRIENETGTQIKIPGKGQTGDVVVQGNDVKSVRSARLKLELLVEQSRRKQTVTHFISFPLNEASIQDAFLKFQDQVLASCSDCRGIDEALFQKPQKLHQTVCVMVLADDKERQQVIDVMDETFPQIMNNIKKNGPLEVDICGIDYMNDNPSEVRVLYGVLKPTSSHDIPDIAESLRDSLKQTGLIKIDHDKVKLHITLMNTSFKLDSEEAVGVDNGPKSPWKPKETFDARRILENFPNYYFGKTTIDEIHLSIRSTVAANGYYMSSRVFKLNN